MSKEPRPLGHLERASGSLSVIAGLSFVAGAAAGLLGALFRLALQQADRFRDWAISHAHGTTLDANLAGLVLVTAACAAAAAFAAWLVRRFSPFASGSGIPHVESVLLGELPPRAVPTDPREICRRRGSHRLRPGARP